MAEAAVKEKATKFALPDEKVMIEFVKRQRGLAKNPKHVMYGGMLEGSKRVLVPKKSQSTFKYVPILSAEEAAVLEEMMGIEKGGLNFYKSNDNYWDSITLTLYKEGVSLDLSNPVDYIKYKIALSYEDLIAPSIPDLDTKNKYTYMFVIVRKGEKENKAVNAYTLKKEAYSIADKLETNLESVKDFLYLYGIRAAGDASVVWLKSKLGQIVEEDPSRVVDIYSAKDYATRALIARGVLAGVIKDVGGKYYLEDGAAIAYDGAVPTLTNAIKFLRDKRNTTFKNTIQAKIGV